MGNTVFSFIVLSFNSDKYIQKCLFSINQAIEVLNSVSEVFVIDNGSTDKSVEILSTFKFCKYITFKTIFFKVNTGTTFSRNTALKQAVGKYIVILDSDAYINSDVLINLKKYLEDNHDCGLAVPKLIYPDGRYQLSVDQFPTIIRKFSRYLFLKKTEGTNQINEKTDVDYAISAFWMLPFRMLKIIGYLDERIFYSPEDVDYCIRIWKAGYKITYIPDEQVVHDAQELSRARGFRLVNYFFLSHLRELFYLFKKRKYIFSTGEF